MTALVTTIAYAGDLVVVGLSPVRNPAGQIFQTSGVRGSTPSTFLDVDAQSPKGRESNRSMTAARWER